MSDRMKKILKSNRAVAIYVSVIVLVMNDVVGIGIAEDTVQYLVGLVMAGVVGSSLRETQAE